MRVIFRPAALLMEPFSSARLFFFPLPGGTGVGHGMGKEATVPLLPIPGLPSSPCNRAQGPACNSGYERPSGLAQVPRLYHSVPVAKSLPSLTSGSSYHVHRLLGGRGWSCCRSRPGCRSLSSVSPGTISGEGHRQPHISGTLRRTPSFTQSSSSPPSNSFQVPDTTPI